MVIKPILFNTEMVRAILDGRKTQTRRVAKGPPPHATHVPSPCPWVAWETDGEMWHIKPPFFPGDVLYVRETWSCWRARRYEATADICFKAGGPGVTLHFANGNTDSVDRSDFDAFTKKWFSYSGKWFPSIHMPKKAARIFLRVKNVYAERLQKSFSEPIAPIFAVMAEGVEVEETCRTCIEAYGAPCCVDEMDDDGTTHGECGMLDDARDEFADLWNSTVKPADRDRYGWSANPWVWVIEFERCEKPEDLK